MLPTLTINLLADHPEVLPRLERWLVAEWPAHYGPGGPGNAAGDLRSFSNRDDLPLGIVAFDESALCGVAALKAESIASHRHLTPWAAAGLVAPWLRRQGIGASMLAELENQARRLGFDAIYCGTNTAESLLLRADWALLDRITHEGQALGIYHKLLR